ncbi:MAG: TorF family putative porin [Paludibacter sp.]
MKKVKVFAIVFIALVATTSVKAQEFSVNADIVSSYVWRGVQYSGASIQPTLQFSTGGFSIGSWGSAGFDGFLEMDLYAKYAFDFGLTVGLTDYYYPGTDYFDNSTATGAHGYEVNLGYATGGLSIGANYILNEAGGAATAGGDKYFELGYAFNKFSIFAGAGDGWHTPTGDFNFVNLGISSSKEIKVSDTFSIPVKVTAILNPTTEQFFLVAGITL